jgi:Fe2+ transport system protein FeoA
MIKPLSELHRGQSGWITALKLNDPNLLNRLQAMNLTPNSGIKVINSCAKSIVFRANQSVLAIEQGIAARIMVWTDV